MPGPAKLPGPPGPPGSPGPSHAGPPGPRDPPSLSLMGHKCHSGPQGCPNASTSSQFTMPFNNTLNSSVIDEYMRCTGNQMYSFDENSCKCYPGFEIISQRSQYRKRFGSDCIPKESVITASATGDSVEVAMFDINAKLREKKLDLEQFIGLFVVRGFQLHDIAACTLEVTTSIKNVLEKGRDSRGTNRYTTLTIHINLKCNCDFKSLNNNTLMMQFCEYMQKIANPVMNFMSSVSGHILSLKTEVFLLRWKKDSKFDHCIWIVHRPEEVLHSLLAFPINCQLCR